MCDSEINRRAFTAASIAAGAAIAAAWGASAQAQAADVKETDVSIKTPDGETDAALYTPAGKGPWPGVLIFTDIFGLRPAFRDMGKRMSAEGYLVLIPNPFYRTKKGPLLTPEEQAGFNFAKDGAKLQPHTSAITTAGTTSDETVWLAHLDNLPQVSKRAKLAVNGYCMGGPRVVQASALRPDRVGAAVACHPRQRLDHRQARQPAPACVQDQGQDLLSHRPERRGQLEDAASRPTRHRHPAQDRLRRRGQPLRGRGVRRQPRLVLERRRRLQ